MSDAIIQLMAKGKLLAKRITVLAAQIESSNRFVAADVHGRFLAGHFLSGAGPGRSEYMANDTVTSIINDAYIRSIEILQAELDIVTDKIQAIETLLGES